MHPCASSFIWTRIRAWLQCFVAPWNIRRSRLGLKRRRARSSPGPREMFAAKPFRNSVAMARALTSRSTRFTIASRFGHPLPRRQKFPAIGLETFTCAEALSEGAGGLNGLELLSRVDRVLYNAEGGVARTTLVKFLPARQ